MAKPGDVLEAPRLGVRIEFRRTTEETGGELVEFDVVGRPRGFLTRKHVHPNQTERQEVIEGSMLIETDGTSRVLQPREAYETPAGTPHRHIAAGSTRARVRIQVRPAARTEEWLERIVAMDNGRGLFPGGWPRPVTGARLLVDFPGEAYAASPPLRAQQALARGILRGHARLAQRRR